MTIKKGLENKIRGWLPQTPTMPNYGNNSPMTKLQNTEALGKPMPRILDYKFYRNSGLVIGLGFGLMVAGLFGWLSVSRTYAEFQKVLSYAGSNPDHYYLRDLIGESSIYLSFIASGAVVVLWGALILKNRSVRELFESKGPYARLGNGLIGGGGALAFSSLRPFFQFVLTSYTLELNFFIAFFSIGIILCAIGLMALRRKR